MGTFLTRKKINKKGEKTMSNKETQEQLRNLIKEMGDLYIAIGFKLFSKTSREKANNDRIYWEFCQSINLMNHEIALKLLKLEQLIEKNIENPLDAIFEKIRLIENLLNLLKQISVEYEKNNEELDINYEKLKEKCHDFLEFYDSISIVPKKETNENRKN